MVLDKVTIIHTCIPTLMVFLRPNMPEKSNTAVYMLLNIMVLRKGPICNGERPINFKRKKFQV